ncbi:MAG: RsiV family protein [Vulcanimicrobiota bacterium]
MKKICSITAMLLIVLFSLMLETQGAYAQSFTWTVKKAEKKGTKWIFTYQYPELSAKGALMGVQGVVKDFNKKIKEDVEKEQKKFTDAVNKNKRPKGAPDIDDEHRVACTAVAKTSKYASFMFDHYEMMSGMAHPDNWYSTVNWTAAGKTLAIEDLFIAGKKGMERLSAESGKLLQAKVDKSAGDLVEEGWAPEAANFKNFCMSPEGLHVYFNSYQIGPRPVGAPDILIPWKALDSVLSPLAKDLLKK